MTTDNHLPRRSRGFIFWAGSALVLVSILLAALATRTLAAGASAKAALRAEYAPPGQMVDAGGFKMHISCQGIGSPTVILEAGLGDFSPVWSLVQPEIAATTRVCTYDRAGMGWSERSPQPRAATTIASELHTLLARAGVLPPYIMVGHSLGGLLVRMYAYSYPQDVAGMVLIDSSHEDQWQRLPEEYLRSQDAAYAQAGARVLLVRILTASGILAQDPGRYPVNEKLPQEAANAYRALGALHSATLETLLAEREKIATISDQVRAARSKTLGDVPLIVVSHGLADPVPATYEVSAEVVQQQERIWNELQGQLAALSPKGRRVMAAQSGHYVQLDQPDIVVAAVKQALAEARK